MAEVYDDRRQEPRFATHGEASFLLADRPHRAELLDLSLNGMKVTRPDGVTLAKGDRFRLTLMIPQTDRFAAEVVVVYAGEDQLGLEFYDMPPRDFGLLAGLIEQFLRLRRQNGSRP